MRLLRIMIGIIVTISLLIVLIFTLLGLGIFSGVHSIVDEANKEVVQTITQVESQVQIKVPLYEKRVIQYTNVPICVEKEKNDHFFQRVVLENGEEPHSSKFGCADGGCTISIDLETINEIPEYLYLYTENTERQCKKTKYMVAGHISPLNYTATVEFTEALKKLLDLSAADDHYAVQATKTSGIFIYQIMGTKKLSLSYNKPIERDILLVNSVKKADIIFDLVPDSK